MAKPKQPPTIRCAIYTRKSSEDGLEQEFNSLDAQRQSGEAYIESQRSEGWVCLDDRYDDGGFSGGNMERPALRRLVADIGAGRVDCVVVYKVDRLSRSLVDFARMIDLFEKRGVMFVSVTQQFSTVHSHGKLMMNILLSFAQFEREIVSERTRDKIAASRRRGQWAGGAPVLGYDRAKQQLTVNEAEAERVRAIFNLYLELNSMGRVLDELDARGWRTKEWITAKGKRRGGHPFEKSRLYKMLTNVVYIGKVTHHGEAFEGLHEGIVDPGLFERVQDALKANANPTGPMERNKPGGAGALLKGLMYCGSCGSQMTHSYTVRAGQARYRYYRCSRLSKRGRHHCDTPSLPAYDTEAFVLDKIRPIATSPEVIGAVIERSRRRDAERLAALRDEAERLDERLKIARCAATREGGDKAREQTMKLEARVEDVRAMIVEREASVAQRCGTIDGLHDFDGLWSTLSDAERCRVLRLTVERIEFVPDESGEGGALRIELCDGIEAVRKEVCA
ncbi:MAG: recombinase family protein [Phycisphaerales bacterium]|nr:recombinase family protein [Phycisphaerales bacterium]